MTLTLVILGVFVVGFWFGYRTGRNMEAVAVRREPTRKYSVEELRRNPMKPYECPICGSSDPYAYTRCMRAGCTDGRDPR